MGDQHPGLVPQQPLRPDHLVEHVLPHVGVHGGQGVVQQVEGAVAVHGPCHAQPLLLSSAQVDALLPWTGMLQDVLLTYLRLVASWQHLQVRLERAGLHHPVVERLVVPLAEGDVALQGGVLNPGLLGHVGRAALHIDRSRRPPHLPQQGRQQGPHLIIGAISETRGEISN